MEYCKYCKDFNEEKEIMEICQIYISAIQGYFNYNCPVKYCPFCGKILNRYK